MIKDDEREKLEALISIGLNNSEAKIYLGLLTRQDFSANEIAKYAKLSRPAAYDILEKMIRLGLCEVKPGKVKKFVAVSPAIGLPHFIEYQAKEQKTLQQNREQKINKIAPLLETAFQLARGQDDPLDYFELLRDKKQIINRIFALQEQVKTDILTLVKPPIMLDHKNNPRQFELYKRGVVQRSIYQYTGNYDQMVEWLKQPYDEGEDSRICKSLPMKLQIYDSSISLFALNDPFSGEVSVTTLCIAHRDFSFILRRTFEAFWAESIPYIDFVKNPALIESL